MKLGENDVFVAPVELVSHPPWLMQPPLLNQQSNHVRSTHSNASCSMQMPSPVPTDRNPCIAAGCPTPRQEIDGHLELLGNLPTPSTTLPSPAPLFSVNPRRREPHRQRGSRQRQRRDGLRRRISGEK